MTEKPVYFPRFDTIGVSAPFYEFECFKGTSLAQRQRSIASLHAAVRRGSPDARVLEISRMSTDPAGVALSAFNLKRMVGGAPCSVESLFQAGKVFEGGIGPFPEWVSRDSKEVLKAVREKSEHRRIVAFEAEGVRWPTRPVTAFYDWLYLSALRANPELSAAIEAHDAFTDIVFNPNKSRNCQAAAAALYRSLKHAGMLEEALSSPEAFLRLHPAEAAVSLPVSAPARCAPAERGFLFRVNGETFEFMHEPAFYVVKRYAMSRPGLTLAQLKAAFPDQPDGFRDIVHAEDDPVVLAHPGRFSRPVRLDDGTLFVVTTEWDMPTVRSFCRFSQTLGEDCRVEEV